MEEHRPLPWGKREGAFRGSELLSQLKMSRKRGGMAKNIPGEDNGKWTVSGFYTPGRSRRKADNEDSCGSREWQGPPWGSTLQGHELKTLF